MRKRIGRSEYRAKVAFWIAFGLCGSPQAQAQTGVESQVPAYFSEAAPAWWKPKGELLWEAEIIPAVPDPEGPTATRTRVLLQVGWLADWRFMEGELAFRSALGSDGNALDLFRYDQRPSNGTWLQRASLRFQIAGDGGFGNLVLGLQGNPLISQESLWDHDLAINGVSFRAAFRRDEIGIQEAGIRAVAGRVLTFTGEDADLVAAQGVFRIGIGGFDWTAHLDHWAVRWDRGLHRFEALPGQENSLRQVQRMEVIGVGVRNTGGWPWEVRGIHHRNPATQENGGELQAWFGARTKAWRPQVGVILQRFAPTGTFAPLNGDEWWFVRGARGPRYVLVLPMPNRWRLTLSHLEQTRDGDRSPVRRTTLSALWRF